MLSPREGATGAPSCFIIVYLTHSRFFAQFSAHLSKLPAAFYSLVSIKLSELSKSQLTL